MPWHKVRVYYDRAGEQRRRAVYRLDLSIIVAAAVMVVMLAIFVYPVFDLGRLEHSLIEAAHGRREIASLFTFEQKVCGFIGLLCLAYIWIASAARRA